MKNDERNGERNKKRIFACNRAALIAVFVLSLIVFAGGCTVKSLKRRNAHLNIATARYVKRESGSLLIRRQITL